jgi:hypothetical protein
VTHAPGYRPELFEGGRFPANESRGTVI